MICRPGQRDIVDPACRVCFLDCVRVLVILVLLAGEVRAIRLEGVGVIIILYVVRDCRIDGASNGVWPAHLHVGTAANG